MHGVRGSVALVAAVLALAACAGPTTFQGRYTDAHGHPDPSVPTATGTHHDPTTPAQTSAPATAVAATPDGTHHVPAGTTVGSSSPTAASSPSTASSPYELVRDRMLSVLGSRGPEAALVALDRAIAADPEVSGICHAVAHDLGHAALQLYRGVASRALSVRNDVCGGGYTHGVVEVALGASKDVARDLTRICAPRQDGSCWHGVGHGVMFAVRHDSARAVSLCRRAPGLQLKMRCAEGVYMQLFTLDDGAGHTAGAGYRPPTPASAALTCRRAPDPYSNACWYYSPTVWLQARPEDWTGAASWCRAQREEIGRRVCLRGVGSRLVKYHPDDVTFAARTCRSVAASYLSDCLRGMGSYWSVHWKGARAARDVCRSITDRPLAARCRSVLSA